MKRGHILKIVGGLCMGAGVGVCFGVAMGNVLVGLLIGLGIGICYAGMFSSRLK